MTVAGRTCLLLLALSLTTTGPAAHLLQSGVSITDDRTRVVRWANLPVDFVIDGGTLGGLNGFRTVADGLDTWDFVPTARRLGGDIYVYTDGHGQPVDFTAANLGILYGLIDDGINEVAFDETGAILEALGLDPDYIAGLTLTTENRADQTLVDVLIVLNGIWGEGPGFDRLATMVHELGHAYGLGHSFVGAINLANTEPGWYPIDPFHIPTMYPWTNPEDDIYGRTLEWDDIVAISRLYPETVYDPPGRIPFGTGTGMLAGRVTYRNELPLTGVHVRAVNMNDPDIQIGTLSGQLGVPELFDPSPAGRRASREGRFFLPGLPPGDYHLVVESIDGRDDIDSTVLENDGIGVCILRGHPDQVTSSTTGVQAGSTIDGFRFDIPVLPLTDNDAVEFGLPNDFPFSLAGRPVDRLFLYSNGYVTLHRFEDPDPQVTAPGADLTGFLSRPMARICPLRTHLNPGGNADRKIDVVRAGGQVTVSFNNVPRVGKSGSATFFLDLWALGGFRFRYGAVGAGDALVGYTAGAFDTGGLESASDLTVWLGGTVPSAADLARYMIVDGSRLSDGSLTFTVPASDPFPVRRRLVFPWLAHGAGFTSGLALVSNTADACRVRLTAYDIDGRLLPVRAGGSNPVTRNLGPYTQMAFQVGGLFDFDGPADGWVLVEVDHPDPLAVQGFFLAQAYDGDHLDSLDGAVALSDTARSLIFPRYTGGPGTLTEVTVVNPNPQPSVIELRRYWSDGTESLETDTLPANGAGIYTLRGAGEAYVVVDGERPLAGFAMNFDEDGSLAGQPGHFLWQARSELVSPYFVHLNGVFASQLDLVNPNDATTRVTVTLYDRNGLRMGQPVQLDIGGWYSHTLPIDPATFQFTSGPGGVSEGWVWVAANRPILGAMSFGDPEYRYLQTTLALQGVLQHQTLHAHLAHGLVGNIPYLTGLAVLSLAPANDYTLDVYSPAGQFLHGVTGQLGDGQRGLAQLGGAGGWMPNGPWPMAGGYLIGEAERGMAAYEIFSTVDEEFYAAVPPQRWLPIQEEAHDFDNGWPEYAEQLDTFPVSVRGWVDPTDHGWFLAELGDGYIDEIEDLYRITLPVAGMYVFALHPDHHWCDMDLYLFDDQWRVIASATYPPPGPEYIEVYLEAGTYGLGVSLFDLGWFETAGYHLLIEPNGIN